MITNLNNNCANTSFGTKFPTSKIIKGKVAPYKFFAEESPYFNRKVNVTTVNPDSPEAAAKVIKNFDEQYPFLSKLLNERSEELRSSNPEKHRAINLNEEDMNNEINQIMKDFGLVKELDIKM